jgi:hypothetical protein
LIAGYLWLFSAWLLFADLLPRRGNAEVYARAFEAGDAIGRIGLLGAASVGAYLIGSLIQAVPGWIAYNFRRFSRFLRTPSSKEMSNRASLLGDAIEVLATPPVFSPTEVRSIDGDQRTRLVLKGLVSDRLKDTRGNLEDVLRTAGVKTQQAAESRDADAGHDFSGLTIAIEAFGSDEDGWKASRVGAKAGDLEHLALADYPLPSFSANRDFFGERRAIQTRLMETAQHAGSEVERLYAESELRFTIALPLAATAIILAAKSGDPWWLALLVAVGGLLAHSMVLRKHAGRELVETLRSRLSVGELDLVTPAFKRYEEDTERLIAALGDVGWHALGMLIALEASEPPEEADAASSGTG